MAQLTIRTIDHNGKLSFNETFRAKKMSRQWVKTHTQDEGYDYYLIRNKEYGTFWAITNPSTGFADLSFTTHTKKQIPVWHNNTLRIIVR